MKLVLQDRTLSIAVAISITAHAALLAVRFAAPDAFRFKPTDPGLEVILVNAKHDKRPLNAEALAQANLDGGGNADTGRAKSPLPNMSKTEDGDSVKLAKRRVEELEEAQRKLMSQATKKTPFVASRTSENEQRKETPQPGFDALDAREFARHAAEISKNIEDYNKRPKKIFISPTTREASYAQYYDSVRLRIEKIGTVNFPQKNGKKLYGELTMSISIYQDGKLYEKDGDGGITIDRSSGVPGLDEAAKRIVRQSAPFGAFGKFMRTEVNNEVWIMVARFKFTRDEHLETEFYKGDAN